MKVSDDGIITIENFGVFEIELCKPATYTALKGMTWREFVNSEYNDGKFSIVESGQSEYDYPSVVYYYETESNDYLYLDSAPIDADENITFDVAYTVSIFGVNYDCEDDFDF